MHILEGEIRAYLDQELVPEKAASLEAHLAECPLCQQALQAVQNREQRLAGLFSRLEESNTRQLTTTPTAWSALRSKIVEEQKEQSTMWKNLQSKLPRPAWIALAVTLILAISLSFAPVRVIANNFLGLFRVEQIRVIQVDFANLAGQLGDSSQIESLLAENVQFERGGETLETMDALTASQMSGLDVRVISGMEGKADFRVQPATKAVFNVDLELVQGILKDLGQNDIQLPKSVDGAVVTVEIPTAVITSYGDCSKPGEETQVGAHGAVNPDSARMTSLPDCIGFLQIPSPSISAPPDLDVNQIGQAYLQILGMQPEEAKQFAQNVDWTSTFIVPIPNSGTNYTEVTVDGVNGTLITHYTDQFILIWLKDDILYALSGPGDIERALELASRIP